MGRSMRSPILFPALAAAVMSCGVSSAVAQPSQTTKYVYYTISGDSAAKVYNAMIKRGPHVNGAKAYASTAATSSQQGKLAQGKSCEIQDYRLKIDFVIRLPKIRNPKALTGPAGSRWQQFSQFLKKHEETHRSIWLECAEQLEKDVRAIDASDCSVADAKATKLWAQMRQSCARRHDAFDAAEQQKVLKHPFVRMVMSQRGKQVAAAAVPVKKKNKK